MWDVDLDESKLILIRFTISLASKGMKATSIVWGGVTTGVWARALIGFVLCMFLISVLFDLSSSAVGVNYLLGTSIVSTVEYES